MTSFSTPAVGNRQAIYTKTRTMRNNKISSPPKKYTDRKLHKEDGSLVSEYSIMKTKIFSDKKKTIVTHSPARHDTP